MRGFHRLVRRRACAAVLQDTVQNSPSGDVVRFGRRVTVVGLVERDVRDVRLPAASHRDEGGEPTRKPFEDPDPVPCQAAAVPRRLPTGNTADGAITRTASIRREPATLTG